MLRAHRKPRIPLAPLLADQHRTRLQAAVVDTKAGAVDMQAAVVVDMKAAADATKLLLLHWAAVRTANGGANQLRRLYLLCHFRLHRAKMDRVSAARIAA